MSGADTHHDHTPWIAAAAVAGIISAAGIAGLAVQQHTAGTAFDAPSAPSASTYRLKNYPHLSHAWQVHHAQSIPGTTLPSAHTTAGGRVQIGE
jgi:hypothetical protein